jgi:hypothetical protein
VPGGKAEAAPNNPVYIHPESPNFGVRNFFFSILFLIFISQEAMKEIFVD